MDVEERWCVSRFGDGAHGKSIINRIMLRYRPIAPKPAGGGSSSVSPTMKNDNSVYLAKRRTKRKYVRVVKNSQLRNRKNEADHEQERKEALNGDVVTLQLLPENTDQKEPPKGGSWCEFFNRTTIANPIQHSSFWLTKKPFDKYGPSDRRTAMPPTRPFVGGDPIWNAMYPKRVIESWLTVECVSATCMEGGWLGSTNTEKINNLENDTCPGFISDGLNRVTWVNKAYKDMMRVEEDEVVLWLVAKERIPAEWAAFGCRVRVWYGHGKEKYTKTVPSDAWRMDGGGFAWRLDVTAALSLGL